MGKEIMIRDLTFSYGGNGNQLEHISLDIAAGEVIVMTGPSGSGKSSLTRVINGLIPYFYEGELSGEVFVDGKPLKEIPSWERGKIVGNVFQDPRSQFFANEVAGEVAFGCENYGYISIISYYRLFVCSKFYSLVLNCTAHAAPQRHKRAQRRVCG